MGCMSFEKQTRICTLLQEGYSSHNVAFCKNISQLAVTRPNAKFKTTGSVKDLPRRGHSRMFTGHRRLRKLETWIYSQDQLWEAIQKIWIEMDNEFLFKLINSMPERIEDVIKAKGGYTRW
ncbi:hypothetical protein C1645_814989 [Glomus cerebriforme]|uniref:Uncharacterized protein n=1 Tax=Glomus cerebriforme TaxID=658196 RepID=A0A397TIM4_9GLOM|nr:hypothetical protein C1645_814989 [Glomus cerebriforme]